MFLFLLITCLLTGFPLIYWYLTRNYDYFTRKGIRGPKPKFIFGNFLEKLGTKLIDREEKYAKEYGKVYGTFNGTAPVLTVWDPQLIRQVLVKDFHKFPDHAGVGNVEHELLDLNLFVVKGEQWKKIRTLVSPTFSSSKMKIMQSMVKEILKVWLNELDQKTASGKTEFDAKKVFGGLTMEVIARCAFATKTNTIKEPDHPFLKNAEKVQQINPLKALSSVLFPKFINNLIEVKAVFDTKASNYLINLCKHIIDERRSNKTSSQFVDFLQLMLNSESDKLHDDHDEDIDAHHIIQGKEEFNDSKVTSISKDKKLTENEIIAQAFIFFVAGYETTATTLTWIAYELSLNPSVQQTLHEEVMSAVNEKGEFDYDTLAKLPYLDAVVSETLRLRNPAVTMNRVCVEDCVIDGTDIKIDKGVIVDISVHAVHHCDQYHPEPYKFNPDRFMPENRDKIQPYTYLPFGVGPRHCIGMRFALMETKIVLAYLVKQFKFSKSHQTPDRPEAAFNPFLNIPKTMVLSIERR